MLFATRFRRAVATFFLLELVGSIAAPSISWANGGPGQPEFTSYESAGSPDMVNLGTGDMTYNVPVLDVPGSETSFSLPLTYRAGIRTEQEASWVGLGWSMNPGAIVRNVNGYPDDANGELATNTFTDPGHHGWYGGVPGILQLGWDSETGHSGSASLLGLVSASWSGGQLQSGDIIGIGAARGEGATFNPLTFALGVVTIATLGISSPITGTAALGVKAATQAGFAVATGVGIAAFGKQGPSGGGFNRPTVVKDHTWFRTKYWVFTNDVTNEAMFGSLYFDKLSEDISKNGGPYDHPNSYGPNVYDGTDNYTAGVINNVPGKGRKGYVFNYSRLYNNQGNFVTEVGSDIQRANQPFSGYESDVRSPTSIAHDDFSVMGPGISGAIRPQRLDVGSLATPRQMLAHYDKYSLVSWQPHKVPFRYENSASNTYTYSANTNPDLTPTGVDNSHWNQSTLVLTDPKLLDPVLNPAGAARIEANRKGLTDGRLVQGKQIDWFTNKEIADAYDATPATRPITEFSADAAGTKDYQVIESYTDIPGSSEYDPHTYEPVYGTNTVTSNNIFRRTHPESGIGAFAVTAEDGTTYHYSLPVYHFQQYSKTTQIGANGEAIGRTGAPGTGTGNYATAWLLTAITGPDYVDRGSLGAVDDQDLGSWVKFSYGKFSSQFKWRQPYVGTEASDQGATQTNISTASQSFQEGAKETYYLNSVTTRTHTALFIKSTRQDGRGHYGNAASNLSIDERTPSSSLRLDEIVVLNNQDLAAIKANTGFSEDTNANAAAQASTIGGNDSFAAVLDQQDVNVEPAVRTALNQKALKRVVFNYSYRLCPGTPNSFASPIAPPVPDNLYSASGRLGKLTLESIATYGPNSVKIIPDFVFDYGYNPAYNPVKRDAFGMYSSVGTVTEYHPSTDFSVASQDGAAWSLTKITNPLGAVTEVKYERDQYAHISELGVVRLAVKSNGQTNTLTVTGNGTSDARTSYRVGDDVFVAGTATGAYSTGCAEQCHTVGGNFVSLSCEQIKKVVAVTANTVTVDFTSEELLPGSKGDCGCSLNQPNGGKFTGYISLPIDTNGGDIRVAAITTRDETSHAYTVKYAYDSERATSSGVISKEPERLQTLDYDFYHLYDYPATPVMYGRVAVLRGNFTTPNDVDMREEYHFFTATSSMVRPTSEALTTAAYYPFLSASPAVSFRQQKNDVAVDIGLLGQAKSIKKFNRRGTLEFSTVFNYANSLTNPEGISNQSVYSEGGIMSEFLNVENDKHNVPIYNLNWTTKRYLPTTLLGTTTTTNNISGTSTNRLYDFYTGAVLETSLVSSLGDTYRSRTVPAYTLYPGMGPKSEAPGNAHMLTQTAATYAYKDKGMAAPDVMGAGIQTWNNTWNYRSFDPGSDTYQPDQQAQASVWRQHRTFAWQSPNLTTNGAYANFVAYDWTRPTQAANWLNVGEVTLYDHYSHPLESKDLNGQYAAQKMGYDQTQMLAAAQNARFTEFAYSGAEDPLTAAPNVSHFGGEVRDGGQQTTDQKHTGQYSSLLTTAKPLGFTYKALVGNANELSTDRTYRASVWVYAANAASGRLYLTLNGTTVQEVSISDASTRHAGDWYQLNLAVPLPAGTTGQVLTVGCRNAGTGSVYADDFRFQPLDSPLQASVYDPSTRQLVASLDNDNLYTRYEYDAAGKVVRVYQEVLTPVGSTAPGERKVKESSYNYAQMRTPTWNPGGTVCATNAAGQNTGYLARTYRDVNTASPTYNQIRLETTNELSLSCPNLACPNCGRYDNKTQTCEAPEEVLMSCIPKGRDLYLHIYQYQYADGSYCLGTNGTPKRTVRTDSDSCSP